MGSLLAAMGMQFELLWPVVAIPQDPGHGQASCLTGCLRVDQAGLPRGCEFSVRCLQCRRKLTECLWESVKFMVESGGKLGIIDANY